jgi:hypothetical protein
VAAEVLAIEAQRLERRQALESCTV